MPLLLDHFKYINRLTILARGGYDPSMNHLARKLQCSVPPFGPTSTGNCSKSANKRLKTRYIMIIELNMVIFIHQCNYCILGIPKYPELLDKNLVIIYYY